MRESEILVLVPAFNEANNLPLVLKEIQNCEEKVDILVINDGSTDGTEEVARRMGARVISLPVNAGMFCALQAGFKYAHRNGYSVTLQVDADGQHDPASIPDLVRPLRENRADIVIGSRFLGRTDYRMPIARAVGTRVFGWITSLIVGQRISDTTCGFRSYNREAIALYAKDQSFEYRDAIGLVMLHLKRFKLVEVPIVIRPRRSGRSSINWGMTFIYPFHYLLALIALLLRKPEDR
ncbi:MAG: glycosyltransferase family 2 protein [Acidobacteria bacterium]|nr:glycosyltransferase family 2 protein [Acidobacteriota bacterium]